MFQTNYSVWIGYHAIIQDRDRKTSDWSHVEDDALDELFEAERSNVGRMQVKQAAKTAALMFQVSQQQQAI